MWTLFVACGSPPAPAEAAPPAVPAPVPAPSPVPEPIPAGTFRRELAPGLGIAAYDPPPPPTGLSFSTPDLGALKNADRRLFVVTIDPARYDVRYLSSRDVSLGTERMAADAWAERFDLAVAWNPGMFEPDDAATGYTRGAAFVGQPQVRRNSLYRAWFVVHDRVAAVMDQIPGPGAGEGRYGPVSALPAAFRAELDTATFATQSLPILRDGAPSYPARENQWSELCFGTDRDGRVVVVFSRWPYEMRELGYRVAGLGLGIEGLVHGEGGPEATLVVRAGGVTWQWVGSYETGFWDDGNHAAWSLPAVLGAARRSGS